MSGVSGAALPHIKRHMISGRHYDISRTEHYTIKTREQGRTNKMPMCQCLRFTPPGGPKRQPSFPRWLKLRFALAEQHLGGWHAAERVKGKNDQPPHNTCKRHRCKMEEVPYRKPECEDCYDERERVSDWCRWEWFEWGRKLVDGEDVVDDFGNRVSLK